MAVKVKEQSEVDRRRLAAEKRRDAAAGVRWVVEVDDAEWRFELPAVSALEVGMLRRDAQMSVAEMVMGAAAGELDAVAAVVWLARRQAGERSLRFVDVAGGLTAGQAVTVRDVDEVEVAGDGG